MAAVNSVGNTLTGATGTGNFVGANTPTLITPVLGVATATSLNKMAVTAPATASTLSVADGKTFTCSNTLTFTGTDSSSVNFGAGGTVAYSSELTSWVAYTPTFVGFGTVANVSVFSRRVGNSLFVSGRVDAGTSTSVEARMPIGFNGTEENVTTDATTLGGGIQVVGVAVVGVAAAQSVYVLAEGSDQYVTFSIGSASTNPLTSVNGDTLIGSGQTLSFNFSVPVSTWP